MVNVDNQSSQAKSEYPAREAYRDPDVVRDYEKVRFGGLLGRYRHHREQRGVGAMLSLLPERLEVLDCPCGSGRWWPLLDRHADRILAIDISPAMLEAAKLRRSDVSASVTMELGDAEQLPLRDGSVDLAFSHALTKHLPQNNQLRVLQELGRVSRTWVLSSFSIVTVVSGVAWNLRSFADSNPVTFKQLRDMARASGLRIERYRRCTTPIGVEFSVLFRKIDGTKGG
jgi:ubiquinone/menaquinone biosynthesis C-methylase UbiE